MSEWKLPMGYPNYRTGETDYLVEAPSDWSDYIPQNAPAQNLYRLHLGSGNSPAEAAKKVLRFMVGLPAEPPKDGSSKGEQEADNT